MSFVLAIEPDARQGGILSRVMRDLVGADLVLVDSTEAAIAALDRGIPDVVLFTALLSPRDEDELVAYLRRLGGAEHLQTHTIPSLSGSRASDAPARKEGGLLGRFRRKRQKEVEPLTGCDPEIFAEEIRTFLGRAADIKAASAAAVTQAVNEREDDAAVSAAAEGPVSWMSAADGIATPAPGSCTGPDTSAWSDPFAWRSSYGSSPLPSAPHTSAAAERERVEDLRRLQVRAAEAAERARLEELARLEAEAAIAAVVERAREEERLAAHRREAERLAAERAHEEERRRLEAELALERRRMAEQRALIEAAAARERETERLRVEAEAIATRARQEEARRLEAERRQMEAEAAAAHERAERHRIAEEAAAATARAREEERSRLEAERQEEARARREAGRQRRALRRRLASDASGDGPQAAQPLVISDQFAQFREEYDHVVPPIFRHMPVTGWARPEPPPEGNSGEERTERGTDDLRDLMSGLRLPPDVAGVAYARGCRIRRVRVPVPNARTAPGTTSPTVILSKRALEDMRSARLTSAR